MTSTYSKYADICAKFYELTLDKDFVGSFVYSKSGTEAGQKALFVGGMFDVAAFLFDKGLDISVVDYTDEMVEYGRKVLSGISVEKANLISLPFENEFDVIFVIGRVFTHMISNTDLMSALGSCFRALKPNGKLMLDNYEDSKICVTNYFNGVVKCADADSEIIRDSKTTLVSASPFVVSWDATYSGVSEGQEFKFSDSMEHRAWSREEIFRFLEKTGFSVLSQGDNFDETSFYTLVIKE